LSWREGRDGRRSRSRKVRTGDEFLFETHFEKANVFGQTMFVLLDKRHGREESCKPKSMAIFGEHSKLIVLSPRLLPSFLPTF